MMIHETGPHFLINKNRNLVKNLFPADCEKQDPRWRGGLICLHIILFRDRRATGSHSHARHMKPKRISNVASGSAEGL